MACLRIAELLANAPIDPEAHLDAARVERYARTLDALPPVVVVDTPEGLLLADGYHRVAASRRLGLEEVEAEVRTGTRRDAPRRAATDRAGARRGRRCPAGDGPRAASRPDDAPRPHPPHVSARPRGYCLSGR